MPYNQANSKLVFNIYTTYRQVVAAKKYKISKGGRKEDEEKKY